jgi:hypothetical protein
MLINYGKKMLDITSGCRSLFGIEQEETAEEVICFVSLFFFSFFS